MKLVLRLVETGIDSSSSSVDVLEIVGRSDPGDIAALGVTLSQGKASTGRPYQPALAQTLGEQRRQLGLPVPHRLVSEHEAPDQEHLPPKALAEAPARSRRLSL